MKKKQKGLSLMEVMITLVIIAIIAGMTYPRYQKMVKRSKQTEAKTILQSIHMAQDLYKTANDVFTDNLDDLDIEIPSDTKYVYSLSIGEDGTTFLAKAMGNLDSDPAIDEWQIDEENNLVNTVNDAIEE